MKMEYVLPQLVLLVVVGMVSADPQLMNVPVRFVTDEDYAVGSKEMALFQADIDCDNLVNSVIDVCAELPLNWNWDPFKGYVYLNIFNDSANVVNANKSLASSGKPGDGHTPVQCIQLKKWPGGDLFIRIDANDFTPIRYTVSAQVTSSSLWPQSGQSGKMVMAPRPARLVSPNTDSAPIVQLSPVVALGQSLTMQYDTEMTLVMDICLNHYQPNLLMVTSVIATSGVFTHFVCDALPCIPDSGHVLCSSSTPTPVAFCAASLSTKPKQVFVTLHAAGGEFNSSTKGYTSDLKFGASFKQLTQTSNGMEDI